MTDTTTTYRTAPFTLAQKTASNFYWGAEHLLGSDRFEGLLGARKQRHDARLLEHLEAQGRGRLVDVERVSGITTKSFQRRFHHPGVPVILSGAAREWTCCKLWSLDYFAQNYGAESCSITDYGEETELPMASVIERIRNGTLRGSHFSRLVHNNKALSSHVDMEFIESFYPADTHKTTFQFFIGAAGLQTKIHAGATNNFHVQVHGEKTWWITHVGFNPVIRPRVTGSPLLSARFDPTSRNEAPADPFIDVYKAKLYPGDILYVPAFYWHHVSYDTESIATGFRWVTPRDVARGAMSLAIMATATKPSFLEYYVKSIAGKLVPFYGDKRAAEKTR